MARARLLFTLAAPLPLLLMAAPALAGVNVTLYIDAPDGKATCTAKAAPAPGRAGGDHLTVSLTKGDDSVKAPADLTVTDGKSTLLKVPKDQPSAAVELTESLAGKTLVVKRGETTVCEATAPGGRADPSLTAAALVELARKGIRGHERSGRTLKLHHLPDGALAFPVPVHVSEEDHIQLAVQVPADAQVEFAIKACDDVPSFRVLGSYKDAVGALGDLKSREEQEAIIWIERLHDKTLRCAKTLTYQITVTHAGRVAAHTTSLDVEPVYHLSFNAGLVFDFGRRPTLSLKDRAKADGMGGEKFVSRSREATGVRPLVTIAAHPCGVNPRDFRLCDGAVMPFVGLDPARLTEGLAFGLQLSPFYGFGFVGGLAVFKVDALDDGARVQPGEAFTATGELPKHQAYTKDSVGFFLGVALSPDVLSALKK